MGMEEHPSVMRTGEPILEEVMEYHNQGQVVRLEHYTIFPKDMPTQGQVTIKRGEEEVTLSFLEAAWLYEALRRTLGSTLAPSHNK